MDYVLKVKKPAQAKALLAYLQTLDSVELIPTTPKQKAGQELTDFLDSLPVREHTQAGVNKAVGSIRRARNGKK